MEFTLFYRGELRSNGTPGHKQKLRRAFHPQLERLWALEPLKDSREHYIDRPEDGGKEHKDIDLLEHQGAFDFAPLISAKLCLAADLNITMLRPEDPGTIVLQSGDIDNRLKTLFDALGIPAHENQIPADDSPRDGENPIFCLLQDDRLITSVSVNTDRLLEADTTQNEVVLLIHVKTRVTKHIYAAIPFL
jgi:hypothetical protein